MEIPTILIVDDREFDRILYKEYLDSNDYNFLELDDGEGIKEFLQDKKVDLILLDWQMPRVGGLETLKAIKKSNSYREIPIIIITGLQNDEVLEEAFDQGCTDFLNKPVKKIELMSRVTNVLKLSQAQNMLLKQNKELEELNEIIRYQKDELKSTLQLKTEMAELKQNALQKKIEINQKKNLSKEVDVTKILNELKGIKLNVSESISLLKNTDLPKVSKILKGVERKLDSIKMEDGSLDEFKNVFESIDPQFFKKLTEINPKLSSLELKNCAYIRMNMDNYEVSRILNIELKSLQMTRYRLKKKLKLSKEKNLREFIMEL